MKQINRNNIPIYELQAMRILRELYEKAQKETDSKVHIREIRDGHIGDTIERF